MNLMMPFSMLVFACSNLYGRVWTDTNGRRIEAEMVRIEDDQVVVMLRGKETKIPLALLSDEDRKFSEEWKSRNPNPAISRKTVTLLGHELTMNGEVNTVRSKMSLGTRKVFGDKVSNDEELEIGICLPESFDLEKPQKILWICISERVSYGAQKRRLVGELETVAETATKLGWVVIGVDKRLPEIPRDFSHQRERYFTMELYSDAVGVLEKGWPGFKASQFAFTGNQIAVHLTPYWSGHMLRMNYQVLGSMIFRNPIDPPDRVASSTKCDVRKLKKLKYFFALETITDTSINRIDIENQHRQGYERIHFDYRPSLSMVRDPKGGTPLEPINPLALKAFLEWVVVP